MCHHSVNITRVLTISGWDRLLRVPYPVRIAQRLAKYWNVLTKEHANAHREANTKGRVQSSCSILNQSSRH